MKVTNGELPEGISTKGHAALRVLGATGLAIFGLGPEDRVVEDVWTAVLTSDTGPIDTAAGLSPTSALLRLCSTVINGATCVRCRRPSVFDADYDEVTTLLSSAAESVGVCSTAWDPELEVFRRNCEGD